MVLSAYENAKEVTKNGWGSKNWGFL
jgi:hypothetical protein